MSKYGPESPPDELCIEVDACIVCGMDVYDCECPLLDAVCDSCGGEILEALGYCPECYDGPPETSQSAGD